MDSQEVKEILKLIASDRCSDQQLNDFYHWLDQLDRQQYLEVLKTWEAIAEEVPDQEVNQILVNRIEGGLDRMERPLKLLHEEKERSGVSYKVILGIAASVLLIAVAALFFYFKAEGPDSQLVQQSGQRDILPGGNKALLILTDGSAVNLTKLKKGEVLHQKGVKIVKSEDGQLVYQVSEQNGKANSIFYNMIQTPVGGQYQINLPDGSKVWLNAASSLRYPLSFSNKERLVELTGEAYFEVEKDKTKPFRVRTQTQTVEVLGTHFNINSYIDEKDTRTTLLEGSVAVHTVKGSKNVVLVPGEQAQVHNGEIAVRKVDVNDAAAWKDGFFVFNDENIPSVMRKIARWYNVEILYEGEISNKDLVGSVSKFSNVSEVLKTLELTKLVHFKINGKKITVVAN